MWSRTTMVVYIVASTPPTTATTAAAATAATTLDPSCTFAPVRAGTSASTRTISVAIHELTVTAVPWHPGPRRKFQVGVHVLQYAYCTTREGRSVALAGLVPSILRSVEHFGPAFYSLIRKIGEFLIRLDRL